MPKTATKTKNITVHSDEIITASSTRPSRTITNTNNDRKNMSIDKTITVTGIKFWNWTITAKVIATFAYNPNTNTFSHTQNSIGTNDGDIFGQGNDSSVPNISFSNHVSVDAVRWAKMNADAGMNIGQQDDWIDAIYTSAELNAAVTAELELLNTASTIVKENTNDQE
jgi:predicted Zn-dependent protease